jgi:hypothetical protein
MTALYHAYTQTVADGTATSVVRPSDWNSAHVQGQTISGNTAGASSFTGTNIVLQGGNNVTLSAATAAGAATIIISGANTVAQTVQTQASGAIAGTGFTSTTTAGTAVTATMGTNGLSMAVPAFITTFVNDLTSGRAGTGFTSATTAGTAIVATQGTNGLSMAVPAFLTTATQSVQTQASGAIAGTGFTSTTTAGTAVTAALGTNGLSMAVPAYITTFVNDLTSGRAGTGFTSTTTAGTAITAALGTNGLSMAVPAYITTFAAQTTQTQASGAIAGTGFTSTTTAGTAIVATQGTNGLSMAVPQYITTFVNDLTSGRAGTGTTLALTNITGTLNVGTNGVALSLSGNAAGGGGGAALQGSGTYTQNTGTIQFANSNGVTFGLSTNQMTASVKTDYAATGFTSTTTAGTAIVATQGTNGLSMAVPAYITTYVNDLTSGRAGTGTTLALTNLTGTLAVNTNGVALSLNNVDANFMAWELEGTNTAGTTATTLTTTSPLYLQGGNNITLSGNSNTIIISAGAGGGVTNQTGPNIAAGGSTITSGTVVFSNSNGVSFGLNGSTMTASIIPNATYDGWAPYADLMMVAGQQGQGTLYFEPEHSPYYVQDRVGVPIAYSNANNSTGSVTVSYWMGFYTQNGSTLSLSASTSFSTGFTFSGTAGSYSLFSGMRLLTFPWNLTVPESEVYIGHLSRTSTAGANASISQMLVSNVASNFVGFFGQSHNTTQQWTQGQGVYTATTSGMPNSVAFSQLRGSDSNNFRAPAVMFINSTV